MNRGIKFQIVWMAAFTSEKHVLDKIIEIQSFCPACEKHVLDKMIEIQ